MTATLWRRNGWTAWHLLAAGALAGLGVLATLDAWKDIWSIAWKDEESSHILLAPIVMAWLIWARRRRFRLCRPTGTIVGPLLVGLGWFIYSFGDARLIQSFWHGGAVLVVIGCVLSILGKDLLIRFFPAFVVLGFMIPVPGRIRVHVAQPLGEATALATEKVLEVLGVAVQRRGNLLSINNIDVTIAEACNGLRMVFALMLVSFAFAFGNTLRNYARFLVIVASPISAMVCNVIRLVPTIWFYGHVSQDTAGTIHDISGWLMVPVAFLVLMGILKLLRWALVPVAQFTLAYE